MSLVGCVIDGQSYKEVIPTDRINFMVHQEKVENGVVLFFVPSIKRDGSAKSSFEVAFIEKTMFGWKRTLDRGGTSGTLESNLYSQYLPKYSSKSPFPLLFGEITDPRIELIQIENENGLKVETEAKIVKRNDKIFWFAFIEEAKEKETYIIKGYTTNGTLIETAEQASE